MHIEFLLLLFIIQIICTLNTTVYKAYNYTLYQEEHIRFLRGINMNKSLKKLFSIILSVLMILSMLPFRRCKYG